MLNTKVLNNAPTFLTFNKPTNLINCMVHGQCVFLFNTTEECSFTFYTKDKSDGLKVSLTSNEFLVTRLKNSNKYESQKRAGFQKNLERIIGLV
jgi:curli biogenesis system outer membrane secretion channel CsgG